MGKLRDQWKVGFYKEKGLPTENSSLIVKYSFYIKKVSGPDWQWGYLLEVWETCVPACQDDVFVEPWLRGGIAFRNGVSYGLGDSHLHSRFTGLALHSKVRWKTRMTDSKGHFWTSESKWVFTQSRFASVFIDCVLGWDLRTSKSHLMVTLCLCFSYVPARQHTRQG